MQDINELKGNPELKHLLDALAETSEWKEIERLGGDPYNVSTKYAQYAFTVHEHDHDLRVKFIKFHLAKEITILNARDNRGMIIGSVDDCFEGSKNKPETYIVVLGDGELRKVSSYNQNLVTKPGIYTLDVKYDATYNSYQAKGCLKCEPFVVNPIDSLAPIAIRPSSPEWEDGSIDANKYQPIVIRGKIIGGYPIPIYENKIIVDEDGNSDTKSVYVGDSPIYQPNSRTPIAEMCPVFTLNLDSEGTQNRIIVNFRKTKYGIPYFGFKDFKKECKYAIEMYENPKDQMAYLMSEINGHDVIVIGYVLSSKPVNNPNDGEPYNRITIRGCSVLDCNYNSFVDEPSNDSTVETPAERLARKAGIEQPSAKQTAEKPASKPVAKKEVKEPNTLVVDAPVVETISKKPKTPKVVIPEFNDDPEGFTELAIKNGFETAKIWGKSLDEITVEYIKGVTVGVELDPVPAAIWNNITKKVKAALKAAYEEE